jgi:rubrerythrin
MLGVAKEFGAGGSITDGAEETTDTQVWTPDENQTDTKVYSGAGSPQSSSVERRRYCPYCGTNLQDFQDPNFCPGCGVSY